MNVKVKCLVDTFFSDTSWNAGDTATCHEDVAARLIAEGFVALAPGSTLSGNAAAMRDRLTREQPKRPKPITPPAVEVVAHVDNVMVGNFGSLMANEKRAVPEPDALVALATKRGEVSLAPGSRLSASGSAWLSEQPIQPPRRRAKEQPKPDEGPLVNVVATAHFLCGTHVLVPGKGKAPEKSVVESITSRPDFLALAPGAKLSERALAYADALAAGRPATY